MKANHIPDDGIQREVASKALRDLARGLRKRQTSAEQVLWEKLRDRRTGGLKFWRQHPVVGTTYVADFCCYEARLFIELDGGIHKQQMPQDRDRQRELETLGYRVLRIPNERVLDDLKQVLAEILDTAGKG